SGTRDFPHYRITMRGSYQQIAEYMRKCAWQRIPVRVVGFSLGPADDTSARRAGTLEARITVEAFHAGEGIARGNNNP
ncbi:MAG: hypothetical protein ACE5EC_08225, partial [Phycisphaerae bacterium]